MAMNTITAAKDTDEYISRYPQEVQLLLQKLRKTIKAAAPKAEELISYQMPAYKYHGMLVYFAAYKNHIGFYPGAEGILAFKNELAAYKGAKGSVQFPLDKPVPFSLLTKIVKFRVHQNLEKEKAKTEAKQLVTKQKRTDKRK